MNVKRIIVYWLMMLIPTVVIGIIAFSLLRHERERLHQDALATVRDRAATLAENLELALLETREGLTTALLTTPSDRLESDLVAWRETNPLIRNVFVWSPQARLVLPDPQRPSSAEAARFLSRYDALFNGRIGWDDQRPAAEAARPPGTSEPAVQAADQMLQTSSYSPRRSLWEFNRYPNQASQSDVAQTVNASPKTPLTPHASGCIPWFYENRLFLLLWVQPVADGPIRGLELETMALLSRLVVGLPTEVPPGQAFALVDDAGGIIHQSGNLVIGAADSPVTAVSIGPCLPHWRIAVYATPEGLGEGAARGMVAAVSLLVVTFLATLLAAGTLLLWQACKSSLDARRKTTFVSNISHELRTPLTSLRMYAELLRDGRAKTAEKADHYLAVIVTESQRLARLVNNVLDFSRLEQRRKRYTPVAIDLLQLVEDVLHNQQVLLQQTAIAVQRDFPDRPVRVTADRDALEQILLNLVDNAIKYGAEGHDLTIQIDAGSNRAAVRVMDRGPGIPVAHRQRIFEVFHRVDDALTATRAGTGLGLSIAKHMIEDMGGTICCRAREGGGACFAMELPADPDPTATTPIAEAKL